MTTNEISEFLLDDAWEDSGARSYVERARRVLLERHRAGASGREIVAAYTTLIDRLIIRVYQAASEDYIQRYPSLDPRCVLAAQGGYGRGELNPQSDIDLLFLYHWKVSPYVEAVTEKVLYTLWDAGLTVGHATRNVADSMRMASQDMKIRTSLLDARYLSGDQALYGEFDQAVRDYLTKKNDDRFIREKLAESEERHERYGGSVYVLEPDVKESEGGLRDIHTALWIAKMKRDILTIDDLAREGVITETDAAALKSAQDFLWRVRNELHFHSKKHQDQLTFEEQEIVARALGFTDEGPVKGVETFMRWYYLEAAEISRVSTLIIHRLTDPGEPAQWSWRGLVAGAAGKEIRPGVRISRGMLWIIDPAAFRAKSEALIGIFSDAQKNKVEVSHETRELIRQQLDRIDDSFRSDPAVAAVFLDILRYKERVYETLMEMHRTGVLGAYIPEFGRLLCMALHDLYHIYTVDQHSLRLVRELERLKSGEFRSELPLLTQMARDIEKIDILYLGLMFHDIGKGLGGGHSEKGRDITRVIAGRLGLNFDDTQQLEFLVLHHLLLAHTAFRRDIEDDKLVVDFAKAMGNVSNLKMLYLLTYADMKSVGPQVWNHWKASLLEQLYLGSLHILEEIEKGLPGEDRLSRLRRIQSRIENRLASQYPRDRVRAFIDAMPDRYFLTTPEDEAPGHFDLIERIKGQLYVSSVRHLPEKEFSEITVCTTDRPGLFASIAGVFAAMNLDILSARIITRKDGLILDVFRISHMNMAEAVMKPEKWTRVQALLEKVLAGEIDVARLVDQSDRPSLFKRRAPQVPTAIQIDNDVSDDFTIVEVYTQDRIGVLFTITHTLHQLGLSIHVAKISTNIDQVADIFYVADEHGRKVGDASRLEAIRSELYRALVGDNERLAQPTN
ncbi:MAG TPA: [protein-PII] uridylyltransferase [Verrucomicrobiae bacterium]|jgi:[protein-PII] uridylyltransferase|nr:[protein-PII] uridylyltransferase [Verrucomicrobiae bacterium]